MWDLQRSSALGCVVLKSVFALLHKTTRQQHTIIITSRSIFITPVVALTVFPPIPQWGAADAEIKIPSDENIELKRSTFKAWSRSVYSHTCYAYCHGFLPCLFQPFRSIQLNFFQNLSRVFPVLAVANTGSWVGPQNKIGHPAGCRFPF